MIAANANILSILYTITFLIQESKTHTNIINLHIFFPKATPMSSVLGIIIPKMYRVHTW